MSSIPSEPEKNALSGENIIPAAVNVDIWRNSALRYLGYANEVGEAFRFIKSFSLHLSSVLNLLFNLMCSTGLSSRILCSGLMSSLLDMWEETLEIKQSNPFSEATLQER